MRLRRIAAPTMLTRFGSAPPRAARAPPFSFLPNTEKLPLFRRDFFSCAHLALRTRASYSVLRVALSHAVLSCRERVLHLSASRKRAARKRSSRVRIKQHHGPPPRMEWWASPPPMRAHALVAIASPEHLHSTSLQVPANRALHLRRLSALSAQQIVSHAPRVSTQTATTTTMILTMKKKPAGACVELALRARQFNMMVNQWCRPSP